MPPVLLKHWFDLRNFRLLLTENLYIQKEKIFDVAEEITKILDDKILDLDIMFYEQKRLNTFKNYFILIGIISQILTLTFLLLLFNTVFISLESVILYSWIPIILHIIKGIVQINCIVENNIAEIASNII